MVEPLRDRWNWESGGDRAPLGGHMKREAAVYLKLRHMCLWGVARVGLRLGFWR